MPANTAFHTQPHVSGKTMLTFGYLGMFIAFGLFVAFPFWRETSAIHAQIDTDQSEIRFRAANSKTLEDVTKHVELTNLRVKNYDRLVPANMDLGPFLEQMTHTLEASGIKEASVRVLPTMPLGKSQQLPIEVSGLCTYPQFRHFLEQMESLPRMSSVSHLLIESDAAMTGKIAIDLTLSIYNVKPTN